MSKKNKIESSELVQLRSYPAPWKGELLLVCTKCTKKLKNNSVVANVRKWLKHRAKQSESGQKMRVIGISCIKMCPKGGVTVSTQQQLGHEPAQVSIIRSEVDLEALYRQMSGGSAA